MKTKKNNKIELLNCPFCGSKAYIGIENFSSYWSVGCINPICFCKFDRYFESKEIAISAWNNRNNIINK